MDTRKVERKIEEFQELLGNASVPIQKQLDDLRDSVDLARAYSAGAQTQGVDGDVTTIYNIRNVEEMNYPPLLTSAIMGSTVKKGQAVGQNTTTQKGYRWKATDPLFEYIGIATDDAVADARVTCVYIGSFDFNNNSLAASKSTYIDGTGAVTQNVTTTNWARIGTGAGDGVVHLIGALGFTPLKASSIKLPDTDASNFITVTWNDASTTDYTLGFKVVSGNRVITYENDSTVDQDYTADADVVHRNLVLGNKGVRGNTPTQGFLHMKGNGDGVTNRPMFRADLINENKEDARCGYQLCVDDNHKASLIWCEDDLTAETWREDQVSLISETEIGLGTYFSGNYEEWLHMANNGVLSTYRGRTYKTKRVTSTPYTVLPADHVLYIDTDGGAIEADLPAGIDGTVYIIKNVGSSGNDVTIDPNVAELIEGQATLTLNDEDSVTLIFETTEEWRIV